MKIFAREAAARLFLRRQHLDRPRGRTLNEESLARFVADAGGLQLDSINVVARAHELALWSRFDAYDRTKLERLVYERRALFEYWAHAACLIAEEDRPAWARAMADYRVAHTGWSDWLKANAGVIRDVLRRIRARGPLSSSDFERPDGKSSGWWDWKPAQHALHYLWMTGKLAVHSRLHFQKRYDLSTNILPRVAPIPRSEFPRWHLRKTLRALGAAAEVDLPRYLTFPRLDPAVRRRALKSLLKEGEAVEIRLEGFIGRWFALAADLPALESPPPSLGTTLLSPFDSLLWHRARAKALFDFDYKIEVYVPAPKRVHGYYSLPILHDGRLIGRLDAKNVREKKELRVLSVHFDSPPNEKERAGLRSALDSLARFLDAERWRGDRSGVILPS